MAFLCINVDEILLTIPSIMMNYGNNVPEMIPEGECLGGVQHQIHIKARFEGRNESQAQKEMKNELKEEMREELKQKIHEDLKEDIHAVFQDMLVEYHVTSQPKTKEGNASGRTS
ncbi:hypothetical protein Tco_0947870 [Tanacetum coccineum]